MHLLRWNYLNQTQGHDLLIIYNCSWPVERLDSHVCHDCTTMGRGSEPASSASLSCTSLLSSLLLSLGRKIGAKNRKSGSGGARQTVLSFGRPRGGQPAHASTPVTHWSEKGLWKKYTGQEKYYTIHSVRCFSHHQFCSFFLVFVFVFLCLFSTWVCALCTTGSRSQDEVQKESVPAVWGT